MSGPYREQPVTTPCVVCGERVLVDGSERRQWRRGHESEVTCCDWHHKLRDGDLHEQEVVNAMFPGKTNGEVWDMLRETFSPDGPPERVSRHGRRIEPSPLQRLWRWMTA